MTPEDLISSLAASRAGIAAAFYGITDEQARWRPAPDKWSMLEVLVHICDEEKEDFRRRVFYTLEKPGEEWPPWDPVGSVTARDYNGRDVDEVMGEFEAERDTSLEWLRGLKKPNWQAAYTHPKFGKFTAGDLLASWAVHDYMHIRQLANLAVLYNTVHAEAFSVRYAAP